jgi:hypothetical protein
MWTYILTTLAVAVFPLALAGYGGHLATLALPAHSQEKRKALFLVWSLAFGGILLFVVSQLSAYKSDKAKDGKDDVFRSSVLEGLNQIIREPDRTKQKDLAVQLKGRIDNSGQRPLPPYKANKDTVLPIPPTPRLLPSYEGVSDHSTLYPENFYDFVPYVWGFPAQNTSSFQRLMIAKYQLAFRNAPPRPLKISYLQGDPSSYSLALFLERVYGNAGWNVLMIPRTDIAYITGIYLFQDSIEIEHEGVNELRTFAKDNKIPMRFEQQPNVTGGTFEVWVGRGPDTGEK